MQSNRSAPPENPSPLIRISPKGEPGELRPDHRSFRAGYQTGVRISRMKGTAERQVLPPAFMRGEGHAVAGGVPPPQRRGRPSQSRFACQLSQRESQGCCAPFLPPAFMRGEGHAVAGGVPRSGGESLLSHGFAVPAPPEGKPRALRTVLAPCIYEGGGPRSGRGSSPRGGESLLSHGCAVPAPPEGKPRALRAVLAPRIYEGGGPRSGRGSSPPRRRG